MKSTTQRLLPVATLALFGSQWQSQASITPYTADVNTTYLYHLNEPADTVAPFDDPAANSSTLATSTQRAIPYDGNPLSADGVAQPAPAVSLLGAAGFNVDFGNAANISAADLGLGVDQNNDAVFQYGDNSPVGADQAASHANIFGVGNTFTLEAMIKVPSITSGTREIISTDNNAGTADRGLIFRITSAGQLEFNDVGSSATLLATIPTTGPHAFNAANWYHVAAVYDGTTVTLFWTKLDPSVTAANAIGSGARTVDVNDDAILIIGNEGRGASGEGLLGLIDEVRISNVARTPSQFIFGVKDTDNGGLGDGLDDGWEISYFGNTNQGPNDNPDNDGLTNLQEYNGGGIPGFNGGTNPNNPDTDGDTLNDGPEVFGSSNAYSPGTRTSPFLADSDGDKVSDAVENGSLNTAFGNAPTDPNFADSDVDGVNDNEELAYQSNPNDFASKPTTALFYFINNTLRNGSFELLGPVPGTANTAKATHWDTAAAGDVTYWTTWAGVSTANGDSGTENGGATQGSKRGYMQAGNAAYNMTDRLVQAGDVYAITWKQITSTGTLTVNLVYDEGGVITPLNEAQAITNAPNSNGRLVYRILPGSPAIGKKVGVGIRGNFSFIHFDEFALSIADKDSDSDGLNDLFEDQQFGNNDGNPEPGELALQSGTSDADSDGLSNADELGRGTSPLDADSDDDLLTDGEEVSGSKNAFQPGTPTNPLKADSDGDKLTDFEERGSLNVAFANAPTDPNTADSDFDLISDYEEIAYRSDPNDAGSVPEPRVYPLISNTLRNGSFELLGAAPGTANTAKAAHWDTAAAGDVTYWTLWAGVSTANNNSGTETGGGTTHGSKHAFMENNNAAYNLSNAVAGEGDVFSASWKQGNAAGTLSVSLVYDNAGTITAIPESLSTTATTNSVGRLVYRIPAGSPAIGKQIGIGMRSGGSWIAVDEVSLNVADRDADGDGLGDFWEDQYFGNNDGNPTPAELALQSGNSDADGDQLINALEYSGGTLPNDSDTDNDGLLDGPEVAGTSNLYDGLATDPLDPDTDDDGISDGDENGALNTAFGNQPTDPHFADTDGDGFTDPAEILGYQTNPNSAASAPLLFALIDNNTRNGSFELLGAAPGAPNAAKATHWDTDPDGDVTYWTLWPVEATASDDSGTETGGATNGTKKGYLQGGNAVYNLTTHLVQPGDVFNLSYDHVPSSGAVGLRGGLVYDNAGTITRITEAELTSTVVGNGKRIIYTVPLGSPAIGKAIGVGFKSTGAFNGVDSVKLTIKGSDSDTDGLVDEWELANFGSLAQNGSGDFDRDGTDNATEAALDLLPADAKSRFAATLINGTLTWTTAPGKTFTIERSTTLLPGSWSVLSDNVSGGTYFDSEPPAGHAFYRVILND